MPLHRHISQRFRLPLLFLFLLFPILAACLTGDTANAPPRASPPPARPTATPSPVTVTDDTGTFRIQVPITGASAPAPPSGLHRASRFHLTS